MAMVAGWIADSVRAFGRQLGLSDFGLDAAGAAGVAFENGLSLRLEAQGESLYLSVACPADRSELGLKRLLTAAHPAVRRPRAVRAVLFSDEAALVVRFTARDVSVDALSESFRTLWDEVRRLKGGV